jgi:ABC-type sugar transport system permease subunit
LEKINPKKTSNPKSRKSSAVNLILNVSIFILAVIILYMLYSIYVKLTNNPGEGDTQANGQVASDIIQVEVLNGCGIGGVGDRFTDFLRSNNFDVVNVGNYVSFDVDESLVIDRTGNMANAYKIAKALRIKNENVIQQLNKDYFLDVSIVIGRDYFNLAPFK